MNKSEILETLVNYYSGGNKTKFAAMVGITPQLLSNWIKRNTLDYEQIYKACKDISADWLLSGEGDMVKTSQTEYHETPTVAMGGKINYQKLNQIVSDGKVKKIWLAREANITRQTLDNLLNGKSATISTLEAVCDALGISPAVLFADTSQPTAHIEVKGKNTLHQSANIYADGSANFTMHVLQEQSKATPPNR